MPSYQHINTSTATILAETYNSIQAMITDVIGLSRDGWGQASQNSSQVTTRNKVKASQWDYLIKDINFVQNHITNASTSSVAPTTTSTISIGLPNALGENMVYLSDSARRWICHPSQFYGYPGETINSLNGTSTTVRAWGQEISQKVRIDWPTNLFACYFFNAGSIVTWRPSYTSIATPNDRDVEWAAFIDYLKARPAYEYVRADFLDASPTKITTYTSGTLTVSITAERQGSTSTATRVDFTAVFRNEDLGYITVDPIHGYWNYGPWETP